jgi:hypothetical protein
MVSICFDGSVPNRWSDPTIQVCVYITILRQVGKYTHDASEPPPTHQLHQLRNWLFLSCILIEMFCHSLNIMGSPIALSWQEFHYRGYETSTPNPRRQTDYKAGEPSPNSVLSFDLADHSLISCNTALLGPNYLLAPRRSVRYPSQTKSSADRRSLFYRWDRVCRTASRARLTCRRGKVWLVLPFIPFLILADNLIFVDSRSPRSMKYSMGYQISDRGFSWYSNQKQI